MKYFVIGTICLRCGANNEFDIGLTNSDDLADYKCRKCNFIVISSWMEEKND